jgi:glycosyltransferase involved in cell wall biosynthesis
MPAKKVLMISSGQPSLNPRLVKEADTLIAAGFDVTVLYAYWNDWGTRYDKELLAEKKWKAICVSGDPQHNRAAWFFSRLIYKITRQRLQKNSNFNKLADIAIARSSYFLIKAARKYKADLYIAHNLGALPAAAKTAAFYNKPYGFDAEDFHRQEVNDDINSFHFKICKYIEDKYLPGAAYLTASSPLITERYVSLYNRQITTLRNVFPKAADFADRQNQSGPLKLFWFSQTIGPNRGLEMIIEAVGLSGTAAELHLLGQPAAGYLQGLQEQAKSAGINKNQIHFYPPVKGEELFKMARQFDIGLASETGFCLNNNMALSNKIFTYIQSGLAVAASDTPAQAGLIGQYPKAGKIYHDANDLADILADYDQNREQLCQTQKDAFEIGQTELNWGHEAKEFLGVVNSVLADKH